VIAIVALTCAPTQMAAAAPGDLYPTFGDAGTARLAWPGGPTAAMGDMVQLPGGDIAVASTVYDAQNHTFYQLGLSRLTPHGTPEPSFGDNGYVLTHFPSKFAYPRIAATPDGSMVVAGTLDRSRPSSTRFGVRVLRYRPDGTLDPTFGGDGKITLMGRSIRVLADVAVQADGRILLSVFDAHLCSFYVIRLTTAGTLDPLFGLGGQVIDSMGIVATAIVPQRDGKILVVGNATNGGFGLIRYLSNGLRDPSFGARGRVVAPYWNDRNEAWAATVAADGTIHVAGAAATPDGSTPQAAVVRLSSTGQPDYSFGSAGVAFIDGYRYVAAIALDASGGLLVSATAGDDAPIVPTPGPHRARLVRVSAGTGAPDRVFNPTGGPGDGFRARAVLVAPSGDVLFGGDGPSVDGIGGLQPVVQRYLAS
jgi:uncharacterized delta-60 repeat protein